MEIQFRLKNGSRVEMVLESKHMCVSEVPAEGHFNIQTASLKWCNIFLWFGRTKNAP